MLLLKEVRRSFRHECFWIRRLGHVSLVDRLLAKWRHQRAPVDFDLALFVVQGEVEIASQRARLTDARVHLLFKPHLMPFLVMRRCVNSRLYQLTLNLIWTVSVAFIALAQRRIARPIIFAAVEAR